MKFILLNNFYNLYKHLLNTQINLCIIILGRANYSKITNLIRLLVGNEAAQNSLVKYYVYKY